MNWTTTPPARPGFYWWRRDATDRPVILELDWQAGELCYYPDELGVWSPIRRATIAAGEWHGPLVPPDDDPYLEAERVGPDVAVEGL